ncbi:MAG: tRNA (N(6)-L-threonylcarbamoyladenosine(37)-C(2))-methylthiotransferase MtaB [Clostridia bacterium]|nr:tRNA (N(6)-L-threonylcarbamoyladenosine(37)-C(2))-methylthiotransferase MtaB [Clostridia bacterium]
MKRAVVITLGCKVNDVESGSLISGLEALGYEVSRELGPAELYVVNTCAVTREAERKSRQTVSKALHENPTARVIVCGCASEKNPTSFAEKDERVVAVLGTKRKGKILEIAGREFDERLPRVQIEKEEIGFEELPLPKRLKTRDFIKIQDGCNRFCSYCVIPYLRGRSRSRSLESVVKEAFASTAYEVVLTGIDISDYKDGNGNTLRELMLALKDARPRIRLGSLEVGLITPAFLAALKEVKNFAPHFHLSLQSGSNSVLKSMNRHYTREEYLEKCRMIYDVFPFAAITTDIIVGFPTETEEAFLESLSIVDEAGFAQVHAFPYSPREGTNAYRRYKELPAAVKKGRVERMLKKAAEGRKRYLEGLTGQTFTVVPETYENGFTDGYTENYIRVYLEGKMGKEPIQVRVQGEFRDGVKGERI